MKFLVWVGWWLNYLALHVWRWGWKGLYKKVVLVKFNDLGVTYGWGLGIEFDTICNLS